MTLKGRKKEKQEDQNEDSMRTRAEPIRMLLAQLTKMLLSTYLISIEIETCPGENG
jgi:hypothetical protein